MSKSHQSDNMISLKNAGFAQIFFNRNLEKWGFWQSYLPLKCSFSVHSSEIATQWSNMIWEILSVFLDSDGANCQITLSKWWFFFHTRFHWLPDSYRDWHLRSSYLSVHWHRHFYFMLSGLFSCWFIKSLYVVKISQFNLGF